MGTDHSKDLPAVEPEEAERRGRARRQSGAHEAFRLGTGSFAYWTLGTCLGIPGSAHLGSLRTGVAELSDEDGAVVGAFLVFADQS